MDWWPVVATALWAMLPAYVPNNAAVLTGGGPPLDFGRTWRGRRLLGDGKTWRGTVGGIAAGLAAALVLDAVVGDASAAAGVDLPDFPGLLPLALPVGALLGDAVGSFVKRRLGAERGAAAPGLDQLDFVVGALALAALADPGWAGNVFGVPELVVVFVATPLLHLGTNGVAYALGLKDEPW